MSDNLFNPSFHTKGSLDFTDVNVYSIYADTNDSFIVGETAYYLNKNIRDSLIITKEKNSILLNDEKIFFRGIIGALVKSNLCLVKYDIDDEASDDLSRDDVLSKYGDDIDVMDEYLGILNGESKYISPSLLTGYMWFLHCSGLAKQYPFLESFHPTRNIRKSFRKFLYLMKKQKYINHFTSLSEIPEYRIHTNDKSASSYYTQKTGDDIFEY